MKFLLVIGIMSILTGWNVMIYADELRDPTRPEIINNNSGPVTQLELNAIIISSDRQVAIINGIVVKVGDTIGNAKVISIAPNTVQLEAPAGKIMLFMVDKGLKKPASGS